MPISDPLLELRAASALAMGWPMLVVPAADAPVVLSALESVLGPLPQAELAEDGDRAEIWVELPRLEVAEWLAVRDQLPESAELVAGESAGRRGARDLGVLADEVVEVEGLRLVHAVDVDQGRSTLPQLVPGRPDPAVMTLERQLDQAMVKRQVPRFKSDRGVGTVQPVFEPMSGQFGVLLSWAESPELQRVAEALVGVVQAREAHETLRLAPTGLVDYRLGLGVVLWAVAPARPVIAWDLPIQSGFSPPVELLPGLVEALGDAVRGLEVQVVPASDHTEAALAAATLLEATELPLCPGPPRWLSVPEWCFAPTWSVESADLEVESLTALAALADHPAIAAVRVMPGDPAGLADDWEVFDLGGVATSSGWAVRLRNGVTRRDLLPGVEPREANPRDDQAEAVLCDALGEAPGASWLMGARLALPMVDAAGQQGLELRLDPAEAVNARALELALRAALAAVVPGRTSFCSWGRRGADVVVQLWYEDPVTTAAEVVDAAESEEQPDLSWQ